MTIITTSKVKQCGIAKAIKNGSNKTAINLLWAGYKSLIKVDLNQMCYTTSAEDLDFRKALFINYRFWMRDVKIAESNGSISRREAIDLATVMRSAAVIKIGRVRRNCNHPALSKIKDQLEDAEATLEQVVNDYRSEHNRANYERSKREEVSKVNLQLVQENAKLRKKISSLKSEVRSQNKTIRVKDQQLKIAKAAILNMANLEQSI